MDGNFGSSVVLRRSKINLMVYNVLINGNGTVGLSDLIERGVKNQSAYYALKRLETGGVLESADEDHVYKQVAGIRFKKVGNDNNVIEKTEEDVIPPSADEVVRKAKKHHAYNKKNEKVIEEIKRLAEGDDEVRKIIREYDIEGIAERYVENMGRRGTEEIDPETLQRYLKVNKDNKIFPVKK